jgi:hypothetical protein
LSCQHKPRELQADDTGRRETFVMELIFIWDEARKHLRKAGTPEALKVAKDFDTALDVLRRTYSVEELVDLDSLLIGEEEPIARKRPKQHHANHKRRP